VPRHCGPPDDHPFERGRIGAGPLQIVEIHRPNSRYAARESNAFALDQALQAGAIILVTRKDELYAVDRSGKRQAPSGRVIKRLAGHHNVECGKSKRTAKPCGETVKNYGTMAVKHAFGITGSSG